MSVEPLSKEQAAALQPGIRNAVLWLREHGYDTTDSGDGSAHAAGMEGAVPWPMVAVLHDDTPENPVTHRASGLMDLLIEHGLPFSGDQRVQIEATYDPHDDTAIILLSEHGNGVLLAGLGSDSMSLQASLAEVKRLRDEVNHYRKHIELLGKEWCMGEGGDELYDQVRETEGKNNNRVIDALKALAGGPDGTLSAWGYTPPRKREEP